MSKQELIQRQFDVSRRYHANEKLNHENTRNITKRGFFFVLFRVMRVVESFSVSYVELTLIQLFQQKSPERSHEKTLRLFTRRLLLRRKFPVARTATAAG
jgi:hypothetical protein